MDDLSAYTNEDLALLIQLTMIKRQAILLTSSRPENEIISEVKKIDLELKNFQREFIPRVEKSLTA